MKAIEDGLKKLGDALADLSYAVRATGGGPWECWPRLVKEERKRQLEEWQDMVNKLLANRRRQATGDDQNGRFRQRAKPRGRTPQRRL